MQQVEDSESIIGGDEKILVVDDDEVQREVSSQLLSRLGYNVTTLSCGEKAVEFISQHEKSKWRIIITLDELKIEENVLLMPLWAFLILC